LELWKGTASGRAAIVFKGLTARLEAVPFHNPNANLGVFPQPVPAVPFHKSTAASSSAT